MKIDKELIDKYEMYLSLKKEFDTLYRYRFTITHSCEKGRRGEYVDPLSRIIYAEKEGWIEDAEIIEEVE